MRPHEGDFLFPPFRLDPANERLWRDAAVLPLRPKLFAVLRHLVEHAGRLVTRDDLLKTVWPRTTVSEGVLRGCVRDLREVLQDDAGEPRFIETVPGRGYRFIASLAPAAAVASASLPSAGARQRRHVAVVGREPELARLHALFAKAVDGERQLVFVAGDPGLGKTTLVDAFLATLEGDTAPWIGRGQCVEHYGAGEPYLPLLEALGRMARGSGGERLVAVLRRYAPSWLAQMPALLAAEDVEAPRHHAAATTRERMLRELVETVEVLTAQRPMVLALEDLHWVDHSTLDWLSAVAKQRVPARLLVIGTYRPAEVSLRGHPLKAVKRELLAHGQCEELWLPFLTTEHVDRYLAIRSADDRVDSDLARAIHRRTDGNPLFVVNVLDYLVAQGVVSQTDGRWRLHGGLGAVDRCVPEGLRQLIEKQIERLTDDQCRTLEVASVVGNVFSARTIASALNLTVEQVEERCEDLAQRGLFLRPYEPEILAADRIAGRYGFLHGLYQTVFYERLALPRRARLHRGVAEVEETLHGERAVEIAAELSMHFERGNEPNRAARYHELAAQAAARSHAYREAAGHLTAALALLAHLPDAAERARRELTLQVSLGAMLIMTKGYAGAEVERCFARQQELCSEWQGARSPLFPALHGLWIFHLDRAEHASALSLANDLVELARAEADRGALAFGFMAVGVSRFWVGQLEAAREALEQAVGFSESGDPQADFFLQNTHPGVVALAVSGLVLWLLGHPNEALDRTQSALRLARAMPHPHSLTFALIFSGWLRQARGEDEEVFDHAREMIELSAQHGFKIWGLIAQVMHGWVETKRGAYESATVRIERSIRDQRATGARIVQTYFSQLLAESYAAAADPRAGLAAIDSALAQLETSGERVCEPELYRLKGELSLLLAATKKATAEAERCFRKAIEVAGVQGSRSFEQRAANSLARLAARGQRSEKKRLAVATKQARAKR